MGVGTDRVQETARNSEQVIEITNTLSTNDDTAKETNAQSAQGCRKILNNLKEKSYITFRVVYQWLRFGGDDELEKTRSYHFWPGKNVFFFRGRLVCGPNPRGLIITTAAIILSSWIFACNVGWGLPNYPTLVITFSVILTSVVLVNLLLVSSIDPGIIPRNDQEPDEEAGSSNGTRRKRVTVNGVEMKLKYCRICKIFRPPRSCHCAVCDNCVEKFDHHCPWIGQCVALRNYRFYLAFIFSALIYFIYIFTFSCIRIHQSIKQNGSGILRLLRKSPEPLSLALFSVPPIGFLGGLAIFHVYLVATNQTAYENFRQRYATRRNPYDQGILKNIKEVLFVRLPPSRVNFRAELAAEDNEMSTRDV